MEVSCAGEAFPVVLSTPTSRLGFVYTLNIGVPGSLRVNRRARGAISSVPYGTVREWIPVEVGDDDLRRVEQFHRRPEVESQTELGAMPLLK